jgi:hypothetical protein
MMGAIQRRDYVSIFARCGWTAILDTAHESRIVPNIFRPEDIAGRQTFDARFGLRLILREGGVGASQQGNNGPAHELKVNVENCKPLP